MVLGCNRMSTQSHPKVLFVPQFLLFACNLRIFSGGIVAPQPRLRYSSSALRFFPKARKGRFMMKSSTSTCSLPPRLVLLAPNLGLCVAALVCIGAPSISAYHARRVSSWLKNWVWTCWLWGLGVVLRTFLVWGGPGQTRKNEKSKSSC